MSNIALDFGALEEFGCFIGSAAVVVFSDQDRIPDVALNLLSFLLMRVVVNAPLAVWGVKKWLPC